MARYLLTLGFSDRDNVRMHDLARRNREDALSAAERDQLFGHRPKRRRLRRSRCRSLRRKRHLLKRSQGGSGILHSKCRRQRRDCRAGAVRGAPVPAVASSYVSFPPRYETATQASWSSPGPACGSELRRGRQEGGLFDGIQVDLPHPSDRHLPVACFNGLASGLDDAHARTSSVSTERIHWHASRTSPGW